MSMIQETMVKNIDFKITDKTFDFDFEFDCTAFGYEDTSIGVNGFYEFVVDPTQYTNYFKDKYNCCVDEADGEVIEAIYFAVLTQVLELFDVDLEDYYEEYYWKYSYYPNTVFVYTNEHYSGHFPEGEKE